MKMCVHLSKVEILLVVGRGCANAPLKMLSKHVKQCPKEPFYIAMLSKGIYNYIKTPKELYKKYNLQA